MLSVLDRLQCHDRRLREILEKRSSPLLEVYFATMLWFELLLRSRRQRLMQP
jgi:hypothetical protein